MISAAVMWSVLEAGAALVGSEAVKVATKEAYTALREGVANRFGSRAGTAIAQVEADPKSPEAFKVLAAAIPEITTADTEAIGQQFRAFIIAMQVDPAAQPVINERAQVRFDLQAQGNILIGEIESAESIDIRGSAGQDIRIDRLNMVERAKRGK
jgi:hypothetical protein